jgi:hypothetical protein
MVVVSVKRTLDSASRRSGAAITVTSVPGRFFFICTAA